MINSRGMRRAKVVGRREKTEMHKDFSPGNLDGKATCMTLAWGHNIKRALKEV